MSKHQNKYLLPIDKKYITHWHNKSSPAHKKSLKHSIDFMAPLGTPIHASFDGIVVWLKNNFHKSGGKNLINAGNRIVIKHKNNEYSAYEHNKYKSAKIKVGQKVKKGQVIALVGSTGWTNGENHLHFEVFNNPDKDESEGKTLKVSFQLKNKNRCKGYCYK